MATAPISHCQSHCIIRTNTCWHWNPGLYLHQTALLSLTQASVPLPQSALKGDQIIFSGQRHIIQDCLSFFFPTARFNLNLKKQLLSPIYIFNLFFPGKIHYLKPVMQKIQLPFACYIKSENAFEKLCFITLTFPLYTLVLFYLRHGILLFIE